MNSMEIIVSNNGVVDVKRWYTKDEIIEELQKEIDQTNKSINEVLELRANKYIKTTDKDEISKTLVSLTLYLNGIKKCKEMINRMKV